MNPSMLKTISGGMLYNLERNDKSFGAFSGLYNNTIGPYNLLAVMAVHDAYNAVEATPLFKQTVKYTLKQAETKIRIYERLLKSAYVTKYNLFTDYCNQFAAMVEPDLQKLTNSILLTIGRLGVRKYEQEKAKVLLACHLLDNASQLHHGYMAKCRQAGVRGVFIEAFSYADLEPVERWMQRAAQILLGLSEEKTDQYNKSEGIKAGIDILNLHLLDEYGNVNFRLLGDLAADALDLNRDTYGDEADKARAELQRIDQEKEDAIRAAQQQAADDEKAELANQLSGKFNVRRARA